MTQRTPENLRQMILTWLEATEDEAELLEVLQLVQVLLTRRRLCGPKPSTPPMPDKDQQK